MKIKVLPEDFVVKEQLHLKNLLSGGDYHIYLLHKIHWNTLDAIFFISSANKIPPSHIHYAGKKDKHAHTYQYISVYKTKLKTDSQNSRLKLTYIGSSNRHISPKDIAGNNFHITLRNIKKEDCQSIAKRTEEVKKYGFPNYFGEQRFGSFDPEFGFFAEKMIKGHYNGALKSILCSIYEGDSKIIKDKKRHFKENWGNFEKCLEFADRKVEKKIFELLIENKKAFLSAIHLINEHDISIFFSAYQSYLWNKILSKLIEENLEKIDYIKIKCWQLPMYRTLEQNLDKLREIYIPTPGIEPKFTGDDIKQLYDSVLATEGIHQRKLSLRKYRKKILKSFQREAIVIPSDIKIESIDDDEIYAKTKKIVLSFALPRGSFATTLIKCLI